MCVVVGCRTDQHGARLLREGWVTISPFPAEMTTLLTAQGLPCPLDPLSLLNTALVLQMPTD